MVDITAFAEDRARTGVKGSGKRKLPLPPILCSDVSIYRAFAVALAWRPTAPSPGHPAILAAKVHPPPNSTWERHTEFPQPDPVPRPRCCGCGFRYGQEYLNSLCPL